MMEEKAKAGYYWYHWFVLLFFPSKNLGCYGDGGAMYTNDDALAASMRMIAHHGQSVQYQHDVIGVNSRLDTIQAAVLKVKLKHLDEYAAARQAAAAFYDKAFVNHPKLKTPSRSANSTHVFHQYTLQVSGVDRTKLRETIGRERGRIHDILSYSIAHAKSLCQ